MVILPPQGCISKQNCSKVLTSFTQVPAWDQSYSFFFLLLFICAYKAWVISPPCPHPLPYHPLRPLPLPPSIPSRNYFALISNFVVERV
jgi:hypothetical protein